MIGHQPPELLAGALAAAIGVVQEGTWLSPAPDRHHQGIGDGLAVIAALIDQPTTRRQNRSTTAAT